MKQKRTIAVSAFILILVILCFAWFLQNRERDQEWPSIQQHRAISICLMLSEYYKIHHVYPESLVSLVSSGLISEEKFLDLQFQDTPRSDRRPWRYYASTSISDITLISPAPVIPWAGSSGLYVTASTDGGGELIGASKMHLIEAKIGKLR